jgi:C4-dicarboxylate transporter DctM subunit
MFGHIEMIVVLAVLLGLVFSGVHIAISLGLTAALGVYLMTGDITIVRNFVANTAYEALRDYVFAVIPLFMLMGDFLAKCGAASDLYTLGNRLSRWLPRPSWPTLCSALSPALASRRRPRSRASPIRK